MDTVKLHDEARLRRRDALKIGARPWDATGFPKAVGYQPLEDAGGAVAGVEASGVDTATVRRHCQGPWGVSKERDNGEGLPPERRAQVVSVEHPDIGPTHSGCGKLRVERYMLAAVCRGDEGAAVPRASKDNIAWLVAHKQGAHDPARMPLVAQLDEA